jgi:hypothetical protein
LVTNVTVLANKECWSVAIYAGNASGLYAMAILVTYSYLEV